MARLRNAIGIDLDNWVDAGVSGATTAVAAAMPAGSALRLVFGWVASNTDQRDREAIERIVRYVADNPGAVVDNLKALGEAAIGAAQQQVSSDDLQQLGYRVAAGQYVLFSVMAAGIVWGFLKSIYEAIDGIIDIIGDLESFIDDSLELLESILSPEGEEACRALGEQVGGSAATRIREIANENYLYAAFHIGEIVGPFVVAILLAYFTAGAGTAAMTSARVSQLLAKIRRIPGASRALDRLRSRMRRSQRSGPLADVTDAEIDEAIEAMTSPVVRGRQRPRIGDRRVPTRRPPRLEVDDLPRRPGESLADAIRRIRTVIGRRVADHPSVRNAWDRAARHVLRDEDLTRDNARELYERTRVRFWREVRDDSVARRQFEDAGFDFPPSRDTAPMLRGVRPEVPDREIRISLDHRSELAQGENWRLAVDANNLEFEFQMPNTFREIVQMRHPNLRQ